jgi:hypothetical protein
MKPCSDAMLRRLYLQFNRRYWAGALPADTQVLWMPLAADRVAETGRSSDGRFVIHLSPSVAGFRRFFKLLLLHEMAHIALWDRRIAFHGKAWRDEMLRVLSAGAARWL